MTEKLNNCNIQPNTLNTKTCFKIINKIHIHKKIEWRFNNRTGCKYPGVTINRLTAPESIVGFPSSNHRINVCWSHNRMAAYYDLTYFPLDTPDIKFTYTNIKKAYFNVIGLEPKRYYGF